MSMKNTKYVVRSLISQAAMNPHLASKLFEWLCTSRYLMLEVSSLHT